jgi:hypothetical protein
MHSHKGFAEEKVRLGFFGFRLSDFFRFSVLRVSDCRLQTQILSQLTCWRGVKHNDRTLRGWDAVFDAAGNLTYFEHGIAQSGRN